jgi:DNA-binding LacI/PurR family transcriptional regulator
MAMPNRAFASKSAVDQLTDHLRKQILHGEITGTMPGVNQLVRDLGLGTKTVLGAIASLERERLIESQGGNRPRRIVGPGSVGARPLRVRILLYERSDLSADYTMDLRHRLEEAGHDAAFASKTLRDLRMQPGRVAGFVKQTPADAWVVVAGSKPVLEGFLAQSLPTFALFGRMVNLPIAATGPRKSPALAEAVRRLVALGHRSIVMLCREERRKPTPGLSERIFLDELETHGIAPSRFNLPDWGDDMAGFHKCLDDLFRITPPTALLISDPILFTAAHQHLAQRGIVAPRDVSMICQEPHPLFQWWDPPVSHISHDFKPCIRRIVRWVNNVSRGVDDRAQTPTLARFIEGGTIGPAPGTR